MRHTSDSPLYTAQGKKLGMKQDPLRKSRQDRKNLSQLKKRNQEGHQAQEMNEAMKANINYRKIKLQNRQITFEGQPAYNPNGDSSKQGNGEFIAFDKFREKYHYAQGLQKKAVDESKTTSRNPSIQMSNPNSYVQTSHIKTNSVSTANKNQIVKKQRLDIPNKSGEKHLLGNKVQDFILDFQNVNNEIMQNQQDKADILGYNQQLPSSIHNRFKSNADKSVYMEKYFPQSTRIKKVIQFDHEPQIESSDECSAEDLREHEGQDQKGEDIHSKTFNKYFQNKMAKSQSIAQVDINQNIGQQDLQDGKHLLESPSGKQIADQSELEESPGLKYIYQLEQQKLALLNKSKSLSRVISMGGQTSFLANTHRVQERIDSQEQAIIKSTGRLNNQRQFGSSKSFMHQSVNLRATKPSYQSQLKGTSTQDIANASIENRKYSYLHNRPSVTRTQGNKNHSINSRMFNPRAVNNLSKNMSINEKFEGESEGKPFISNLNRKGLLYQKQSVANIQFDQQDIIPEQKSLNGSSFEQVSMGSLGSGQNEMNIDNLLKDAQNQFEVANNKNQRFSKTQYLTHNTQKREHPRSYKNSMAINSPGQIVSKSNAEGLVNATKSPQWQKSFYVEPKDSTTIQTKSFVQKSKQSVLRSNQGHSQSISTLNNQIKYGTKIVKPSQSIVEKQQLSTQRGAPRKNLPNSQLSQGQRARGANVKKTQSYVQNSILKQEYKSKYTLTTKARDEKKIQFPQEVQSGYTTYKQSILMMKSPRTPKMDITLKKPLISVANFKNATGKQGDKSEVIPYYSRIKAMASSNVVTIQEDASSQNEDKLKQSELGSKQNSYNKQRADKSQKTKRQSMVHAQSQALLKSNQPMKTTRDVQKQNLIKPMAIEQKKWNQNTNLTDKQINSQNDLKTNQQKVIGKSNSRGYSQFIASQFSKNQTLKTESTVITGTKQQTNTGSPSKNVIGDAKTKSFLMTSRNTISESLYAKEKNQINPNYQPVANNTKTEEQLQQVRDMSYKKHSVQISMSQSIKKLDLSKITATVPDQVPAEGQAAFSSQRKIGQGKKSMALKKSTSTNKIDLISKDGLAQNLKNEKANEERRKSTFPHKKHSLSQPKSLMNYMTAPQAKSTKKALDDTSKTGASGKKVAATKSSANPQGPASQLSGMKLQSKSVLTNRSPKGQEVEELVLSADQLKYPISSSDAKRHLSQYLNDYENQEIGSYDKQIWYLGQNCKCKIKGHVIKMVAVGQAGSTSRAQSNSRKHKSSVQDNQVASERQIERLKQMKIFNYGYDDEQGDYNAVTKDHIAYRYEILESLGSGSFGQAVKCLDHATGEHVAIKIIRNKKKFQYQAGMELKIVKFLNMHDPHDQNNVIRVKDYVVFRDHLIISFELLSINMYEFIKNNNFQGVSQNLIRRFAIQILQALKYQQDHNLVHCDLKPENILLKQTNKSGIKLIDYGSSCFMGQRIYTYIQSRFYRAPEIILGIPYTTAIDMWSFGAIIAELYTGFPLFPGESENEQLAYIMELFGVPKADLLKLAQRGKLFYDSKNQPILEANSRGKIRQPSGKRLEDILKCEDDNFLDFLNKCFEWHPVDRMTPLQALQHPWILEGLPEKVLKHHKKMFGHSDKQETIRKLTQTEIQGFPRSKKDLTIHQIVDQIRKEDEAFKRKEDEKRKQKEREKSSEAAKITAINRHSPSKSQTDGPKHQNRMSNLVSLEEEKTDLDPSPASPQKERKTRKQRRENSDFQSFKYTEPSQSVQSRMSSSRKGSAQEEQLPFIKAQFKLSSVRDNGDTSNRNGKVIDVDIGEVMELQNEECDEDSSDAMDAYLHPDRSQGEADEIDGLQEASSNQDSEFEFDDKTQ